MESKYDLRLFFFFFAVIIYHSSRNLLCGYPICRTISIHNLVTALIKIHALMHMNRTRAHAEHIFIFKLADHARAGAQNAPAIYTDGQCMWYN